MPKIRLMTIEDYSKVYALWLNTPGMGLNNADDTVEGIDRYLKRNPTTCFVAEEADSIVGAILCGNDGRRGYISHTAVLPQCRRQGIGRALVEASLAALDELGIKKVGLVVFGRNELGNAFWQSIGFTTREDLIYRNKNIRDFVRIDT